MVTDLDTALEVPAWIWVDVECGAIEAFFVPAHELPDGTYKTYTARGRFRYVPQRRSQIKVAMGAEFCELCGNPLTVLGSSLCVACNANDRGHKFPSRLRNPFTTHKCEACSRQAEWSVSDEVTVTPEVSTMNGLRGRFMFDRGTTTGRRYYCSWHYQPPRILDERGEVVEAIEIEAARPQW
jgi:hypothetical protein